MRRGLWGYNGKQREEEDSEGIMEEDGRLGRMGGWKSEGP